MSDTDTSAEAVERHLDISHNHEAGLIPVATQAYMQALAAERDRYKARAERAERACLHVTSSLVAAVSLLERGGKNAAWSDKLFQQMIVDYKRSINEARATLAQIDAEPDKAGGKYEKD